MRARLKEDVDRFLGDARKKAWLSKSLRESLADGQIIEFEYPGNVSPAHMTFNSLLLTNETDRRTEPLSISVMMAGSFWLWDPSSWEAGVSSDTNYVISFNSLHSSDTIAAKQKLNIHPFTIASSCPLFPATNVPCKVEVYYGGDRAAVARFQMKFHPGGP